MVPVLQGDIFHPSGQVPWRPVNRHQTSRTANPPHESRAPRWQRWVSIQFGALIGFSLVGTFQRRTRPWCCLQNSFPLNLAKCLRAGELAKRIQHTAQRITGDWSRFVIVPLSMLPRSRRSAEVTDNIHGPPRTCKKKTVDLQDARPSLFHWSGGLVYCSEHLRTAILRSGSQAHLLKNATITWACSLCWSQVGQHNYMIS